MRVKLAMGSPHGHAAGLCAVLVLATLLLYSPVASFDFITLDDPDYVTGNRVVSQGLTWPGVLWAFSTGHAANWHPLTWLSHMLDVQLFGLDAGRHHLVNLVFHLANTAILFLLLHRLFRALWPSLWAAALFASHPLHVESVAWVAERKDVLSTCFGLLALLAYTEYVSRVEGRSKAKVHATHHPPRAGPEAVPRAPQVALWFGTTLLLFAGSLMSKPMLVTLPFVLLLLDFWPLQRFQQFPLRRLLLEKLPFLVLSVASSSVTLVVQQPALASLECAPLSSRLAGVTMAYWEYLEKTFWPHPLAMFYPYRHEWDTAALLLALSVLLAVSLAAFLSARRWPWFIVGWLWFLGTLVPVIGLVQAGGQAMADRYSYFPLVGLFLLLTLGAPACLPRWRFRRPVLVTLASASLVACALATHVQLRCWQNTQTLCQHALRVTTGNTLAHATLAEDLFNRGQLAEAKTQFLLALDTNPTYITALVDLGKTLLHLEEFEAAEARLHQALRLQPSNVEAHRLLAAVYSAQKQPRAVCSEFGELLRLRPDWPEVLNNLAWLLATHPDPAVRNGPEAVAFAEHACQLTGNTNLWLLSTLAAAYAEAAHFPEAVATQEKVCSLASLSPPPDAATSRQPPPGASAPVGSTTLFRTANARLELYRSGQSYHEPE